MAVTVRQILPALPATVAALLLPALFVLAADGYCLYGWLKGCLDLGGKWRLGSLGFLLSINLLLLASILRNLRCSWRLQREIRGLPLLEKSSAAAAPLSGTLLRVSWHARGRALRGGWRKRRRRLASRTIGLSLCLIPWPGAASGAATALEDLSLTQAVATALERHPSLKRLREESLASSAQEEVAKSAFFPRVTLEALGKEGPSSAPGFGFHGLANSTIVQNAGASVVLEQMIFDFGRALHRTQASRWLTSAAEAKAQAQRSLVTLNVYRVYYRALLAEKLVELAEKNLSARESIAKQAQARAKAGLTSRVDEGLARASRAEAQVGLVNARNEGQNAFAELNNAMGVTGAPAYRLEEPPEASPASYTRTSAREQEVLRAFERRPEMQALHQQIQAAAEQAEAARAEGMPLVRALGAVGYLNAPDEFGDDRIWAVGLSLSYPLFTGGQVQGEVASARHREAAIQAALDELGQAIRLQVGQARMALDVLVQSRQAIAEQLTQARDSVKLASQRYREGLGDFLELQQAQLGFLTAETNAARLRYDLITAEAALRYALGAVMGGAAEGSAPGKLERPGE